MLRRGTVLGAGLAGAVLVGCKDDSESTGTSGAAATGTTAADSTTPASDGDKYGGTLRRATIQKLSLYDPYKTSGGPAVVFWGTVGDRLVTMKGNSMELVGALIESWEEIEPGLDYVIHVRKNAVWEDKAPTSGRPWDAEDVIHNIKYPGGYLTPSTKNQLARSSWYYGISDVQAVDDKTVSMKFSTPNAAIMAAMADHRQLVVPKEVPDPYGFENYPNFPSVGPWLVQSWSEGDHATMVRNPNFWDKDASGNQQPFFDGVELQWYGDFASSYAALLADKVDYLALTASQSVESEKVDDLVTYHWPFRGSGVFILNGERYKDPRIWQALHMLIDYNDLGKNIYRGFFQWTGPINYAFAPTVRSSDEIKGLTGWNPETRDEDVKAGLQMLEAAGYPKGEDLSINNLSSATSGDPLDWAVRLQAQFKNTASDLDFEISQAPDNSSFQRSLAPRNFDAVTYQIFEGPDVRIAASNWRTGSSRNYGGYSDPQVDALVEKSYAQTGADLAGTVKQIESILLDKGFPVYSVGRMEHMASHPRVQGMNERGGVGCPGAGNMQTEDARYFWFSEEPE